MCNYRGPGLLWLSNVIIGNNINTGKFIKIPVSGPPPPPPPFLVVGSAIWFVVPVFLFIFLFYSLRLLTATFSPLYPPFASRNHLLFTLKPVSAAFSARPPLWGSVYSNRVSPTKRSSHLHEAAHRVCPVVTKPELTFLLT